MYNLKKEGVILFVVQNYPKIHIFSQPATPKNIEILQNVLGTLHFVDSFIKPQKYQKR